MLKSPGPHCDGTITQNPLWGVVLTKLDRVGSRIEGLNAAVIFTSAAWEDGKTRSARTAAMAVRNLFMVGQSVCASKVSVKTSAYLLPGCLIISATLCSPASTWILDLALATNPLAGPSHRD